MVIDSMPPATMMSCSPARISWSAVAIALTPERQTLLMVIEGSDIGRPGGDARRARRVLAGPGLDDLAHDQVVDLVAGHAGLLQGGLDRDAAELRGGQALQASEQAADRGTGAGDDDGSTIGR